MHNFCNCLFVHLSRVQCSTHPSGSTDGMHYPMQSLCHILYARHNHVFLFICYGSNVQPSLPVSGDGIPSAACSCTSITIVINSYLICVCNCAFGIGTIFVYSCAYLCVHLYQVLCAICAYLCVVCHSLAFVIISFHS